MDLFDAINTRRSIRKFTKEPISEKLTELIIKAAMQAPSARNFQPWHFIVIDDRSLLKDIPKFHPYAAMLETAPMAIAVCGDFSLEKSIEYIALDCAAATQNMLLAAHGISLGAVWLGIYPREKRIEGLKKLLSLPESIIPISLVALGHPAEYHPPVSRFKPERFHRNVW
jgi:nitroreductase